MNVINDVIDSIICSAIEKRKANAGRSEEKKLLITQMVREKSSSNIFDADFHLFPSDMINLRE